MKIVCKKCRDELPSGHPIDQACSKCTEYGRMCYDAYMRLTTPKRSANRSVDLDAPTAAFAKKSA